MIIYKKLFFIYTFISDSLNIYGNTKFDSRSLSSYSSCQLYIFGHYSYSLGMDGT